MYDAARLESMSGRAGWTGRFGEGKAILYRPRKVGGSGPEYSNSFSIKGFSFLYVVLITSSFLCVLCIFLSSELFMVLFTNSFVIYKPKIV